MRKSHASPRIAWITLLLFLVTMNPYPAGDWVMGQGVGEALGDAGGLGPIILVYTGVNDAYGEILASLIRESDVMDVTGIEIFVTADPEMVSLGASLPNTACIVVNADNAAEIPPRWGRAVCLTSPGPLFGQGPFRPLGERALWNRIPLWPAAIPV